MGKELWFSVAGLAVAYECECVFEFEHTDEQFEQLCEFAVYIYLKWEEGTAHAIADTINDLIAHGDYTIDEVLALNKHEFIEVASYNL